MAFVISESSIGRRAGSRTLERHSQAIRRLDRPLRCLCSFHPFTAHKAIVFALGLACGCPIDTRGVDVAQRFLSEVGLQLRQRSTVVEMVSIFSNRITDGLVLSEAE